MGFPFSKESKNPVDTQDRKGKWCIITNVSEPYRRCLDHSGGDEEKRDVIITDQSTPVHFNVPEGKTDYKVDVSQFISNGTGVLPNIAFTNSGLASVAIPDNTQITSSDSGWNGVFSAPVVKTINNQTARARRWNQNFSAITVGTDNSNLSFNKGVRIFFPGKAGKRVGYIKSGEEFKEITEKCSEDSQEEGDSLQPDSACSISENGNLIVWTKHFTTFVAYSEMELAPTASPDGGTYTTTQTVTLTTTTDGASIYYTTNGDTPTTDSTLYTGPITISETTTLKAIATKEGFSDSDVFSATYTINAPATTRRPSGGGGGSSSRSSRSSRADTATTVTTTTATTEIGMFLELLITLGIIPAEKHAMARTFIAQQEGTTPTVATSITTRFTTPLTISSTGEEVRRLQQFLNANGFTVATTGAGSPGNESTYFGARTKDAVIRFQNAHRATILTPLGISQGTGYWGSATIALANSMLGL
jgi:hypothetical protein